MDEKLFVKIQKQPNSPLRCIANHFAARPGSTVVFTFPGQEQATIEFHGGKGDSPFDQERFSLEPVGSAGAALQQVREDADERSYGYIVSWKDQNGDGLGNGGGEVLPHR